MPISKSCGVWLGVCVLTVNAAAQSAPVAEFGLGYAYSQLDTSDSTVSNQSGGSAYGEYFFKRRGRSTLGIVGDFHGSGSNGASFYTYLFGPRFNIEWRKTHLVTFGEFEYGGAHAAAGSLARNSFAWGVNDGLGVVVGQHCVVNLFQIEFIFAHVPDIATGKSHGQGDFRVSGGLGYRFGPR